MKYFKSNKLLIILGSIIMFLSIILSFISKHYESRVMGNAALGIAILAPEIDSSEWKLKKSLRSKADIYFFLSILFGVLAIIPGTIVALHENDEK